MRHMLKGLVTGLLFCMVGTACDSISDYSTKENTCYAGSIIDADFVRLGAFDAGVKMKMSLDVDALAKGNRTGAVITTDDGLFSDSPVKQMLELTRDSLSLLYFPGGRNRNYLAYAPDKDGNVANVVISLMENGDVEVRIFRATVDQANALFGVFRLVHKENCTPPKGLDSSQDTDTLDGGAS